MSGDVCLILHAHIPCTRAGDPDSPGQRWLYNAIADSYLPLLRLLNDHAGQRTSLLTLAVSVTLCEALDHDWFRDGFDAWLGDQIDRAETRATQLAGSALHSTATFYVRRLHALRNDFVDLWERDLAGALGQFAEAGLIELVPSVSSQPILPLVATDGLRRAHLVSTLGHFAERFGRTPAGVWLPSCAVDGDVDRCLGELGVAWAVSDASMGDPATPWMPARSASGVTWFPRDASASALLAPDDDLYAYRDIALDTHLSDPDRLLRTNLDRQPSLLRTEGRFAASPAMYQPAEALAQSRRHAGEFLRRRRVELDARAQSSKRRPVAVCAYPAELFGRVWFEGPAFLAAVIDGLDDSANTEPTGRPWAATPGGLLADWSDAPTATPTASSWGDGGYFRAWTQPSSRWLHGATRRLERRLVDLASRDAMDGKGRNGQDGRRPGRPRSGGADAATKHRAASEALRHLMLAQSSDWHWLIRTGRHVEYALQSAERHIRVSTEIVEQLEKGIVPAVKVDVDVDIQLGQPQLQLLAPR
jgi:1,4-alpha-glucan branching enzyme